MGLFLWLDLAKACTWSTLSGTDRVPRGPGGPHRSTICLSEGNLPVSLERSRAEAGICSVSNLASFRLCPSLLQPSIHTSHGPIQGTYLPNVMRPPTHDIIAHQPPCSSINSLPYPPSRPLASRLSFHSVCPSLHSSHVHPLHSFHSSDLCSHPPTFIHPVTPLSTVYPLPSGVPALGSFMFSRKRNL